MKTIYLLLLLLALTAAPAVAQKPDYLTPEEIEKVRETQDPDKRIALFLQFAGERMAKFDAALLAASQSEEPDYDELRDRMNDFIHAVDDAAAALEVALERGGADLRKTRKALDKNISDFLSRLESLQKMPVLQENDLQYDLEDATIALQDLQEMARNVPDKAVPLKQPRALESEEKSSAPGKPSLKRRPIEEEEKKPPR
ncbi:MAG: hypothetical protein ACRD4D_05230 [Candidatus Acidiferrales bacterium]